MLVASRRRVVAAGRTTIRGAGAALDYIVGLKYDRSVTIFDDQPIDERRNVTCGGNGNVRLHDEANMFIIGHFFTMRSIPPSRVLRVVHIAYTYMYMTFMNFWPAAQFMQIYGTFLQR